MTDRIIASGGPEDDALSAEVLKGTTDVELPQHAVHIADDTEEDAR